MLNNKDICMNCSRYPICRTREEFMKTSDRCLQYRLKDSDKKYPAYSLRKYRIYCGNLTADLITPFLPEERFWVLLSSFSSRVPSVRFRVGSIEKCQKDDYERMLIDGFEYIWRWDGARKMISPDESRFWATGFCKLCGYKF